MEPMHQTTSGSSEPHAPSYKSKDAQQANEGSTRDNEHQKVEATQPSETASAKADPLANVRGSHEDLSDLKEENLVQYTSLLVAYMRAAESKRDDAIINDPYAELLAGEAGGAFLQFFSKWTPQMNVMAEFFALRTRSIDEALIHRHPSIQQIVILGAGLDSRAYRMETLADCLVVEIDASAAMMERKKKLLQEAGAEVLAKQHHVIIADLEQDMWSTQLTATGFDPNKPTFWLLEGLLYYMPLDSNVRLVKTIDAVSARHSQLWADMSGYSLVKASDSESEGLFRSRALKYGEDNPTKGVLSQLQWEMKIQASLSEPCEMYGRTWTPMKQFSSEQGEEQVVPWFFVEVTKTDDQHSKPPLS